MALHHEVQQFMDKYGIKPYQMCNCMCMTEQQFYWFMQGKYSPTTFQKIMFIVNTSHTLDSL